ncbi:Zinc finger protein LEE1 [Nakaseomyces bracarensis]|uniref:Zinc finger protein LEE1 n=1 Tax=Nakaseomyces bracarensis TaxID=273131 RepID=A0ABR4NXX1_9SACH
MDHNKLDLRKFKPHQQQLILQHLALTNQQVKEIKQHGCEFSHRKNCSHIPCKFFMIGSCQAGKTCPFSHDLDVIERAFNTPCKYFKKGTCKFGDKCINSHIIIPTNYNTQDTIPRSMNNPQTIPSLHKQFMEAEVRNQNFTLSSDFKTNDSFFHSGN